MDFFDLGSGTFGKLWKDDDEVTYESLKVSIEASLCPSINSEVSYGYSPSIYEENALSKCLKGDMGTVLKELNCNCTIMPYSNFITPKEVIYNDPATIVFWEDGTKTVVKCQPGDTFSKELGLAMALAKKVYGNKGSYNDLFKKWAYDD